MSRSMPSFAFFARYRGDLPTNTGAPGTVEKTVSVSVVVLPLALCVRLELGVAGVAELDRPAAAFDGEGDWHLLHRDDLADQLHELGDRAAQLARVDAEDRLLLLRRHLVVEVDRRPPVALQDVAWHVRDHCDRPAGHVDAIDRALVETPGDDRVAGAVVGILADPARAEHTAIADFEQASFEVIRHECPPCDVGDAPVENRPASPLPRIADATPTRAAMPYASVRNPRPATGGRRPAGSIGGARGAAPSRARRARARSRAARRRTASPSRRPSRA